MPDPKLKIAAEEIKAVLQKHDCAAVVVLASETHLEYLHHVTPSWSCAKLEGNVLRIRAKREDFASVEAHKKCLSDTIGMVVGFLDAANNTAAQMQEVACVIARQIEFSHFTKEE